MRAQAGGHLVPLDDRPALAGGSLLLRLALALLLGFIICNLRLEKTATDSTRLKTCRVLLPTPATDAGGPYRLRHEHATQQNDPNIHPKTHIRTQAADSSAWGSRRHAAHPLIQLSAEDLVAGKLRLVLQQPGLDAVRPVRLRHIVVHSRPSGSRSERVSTPLCLLEDDDRRSLRMQDGVRNAFDAKTIDAASAGADLHVTSASEHCGLHAHHVSDVKKWGMTTTASMSK